ncbi:MULTISPECIES: hypothetical protein [Bacillales]|uniref:hypothetical protein n=1 Tax=Bacillales TaxID=1385 RepID=UPI0006A75F1A|nr:MULTISPECIES: hypothetical protein [Bacillales]OBZ13286.1 hypothetical protein A7975_10520 [Bacillus sp. FJAT-26390]
MTDGSIRAKQEKLMLETAKANQSAQTSHAVEETPLGNGQNEGASTEWRRFYDAVKQITLDMR